MRPSARVHRADSHRVGINVRTGIPGREPRDVDERGAVVAGEWAARRLHSSLASFGVTPKTARCNVVLRMGT